MQPVDPPKVTGCSYVVFAKDQPEYIPLPAYVGAGYVHTTWKLTIRERLYLLFSPFLHLSILTFNNPLQPLCLSVLPRDEQ